MTGSSCGSDRHRVLTCWETDTELVVLVCWVCGHRLVAAHESQASFLLELMKDINAGSGGVHAEY